MSKHERDEFVNGLKAQGFQRLGGGAYGEAYGLPGKDWVLKIGHFGFAKQDGWLTYARYVMHNGKIKPSKHFPVIYELMDKGEWYVARMERLTPIRGETDAPPALCEAAKRR